MKVLIACEYSGIVRDAFKTQGHDVWSCDILPTESKGNHIQDNVLNHLNKDWDMMIAHPPCTHLSVSGARWFTEGKKPLYLREDALNFVRKLMNAPINKIAIENPVSVISSHIRKSDQTIQPYQFGHKEYKRTCLWLKNLPKLKETNNQNQKDNNIKHEQLISNEFKKLRSDINKDLDDIVESVKNIKVF